MNRAIDRLHTIAGKDTRRIIGLMSGTSMDGLDIALCTISGFGPETKVKVEEFETAPYTEKFRQDIKSVFSKKDADLEKVTIMNAQIAHVHSQLILDVLKKWGSTTDSIDAIASHGQTIYHAPRSLHGLDYPNATLQIGDGDHIAVTTGIITLSDFRQKHIAAGGEGAPLAVYGDYLIFSKRAENRIMLNIGGIANFTFLPGDLDAARIFSTDVGPGNTLMDQYIQQERPGAYYDKDAAMAMDGKSHEGLLNQLLSDPFFDLGFPKTTGPELFSLRYLHKAQEITGTSDLKPEDVMATLLQFSARGIIDAVKRSVTEADAPHVYVSGGGMHNPLLLKTLKKGLPFAVFSTTDQLGINPDAKEAVLFAVLANETLAGNPIGFGKRKGIPAVCMGKISLPE